MTDRIDKEKLQAAGDGVLFGDREQAVRAPLRAERTAAAAARLGGEPRVEPRPEAGHPAQGLTIERRFTVEGVHPFDAIAWEQRTAIIANDKGETLFRQDDCEIPRSWTQLATNVVVSKYFRGG
ncbi:MAG: hypothetical protein ABR506_03760, partial [Candidatus Krumholzibacteriia bacterium]